MDPEIQRFNGLPSVQAQSELHQCCGSNRWALTVSNQRPFSSFSALLEFSEQTWKSLEPKDWLEAFSHHPQIGRKDQARGWAEQEQRGVNGASTLLLTDLQEWNQKYKDQFGFLFLVCATGKSAEEMLALLKARFHNHPNAELRIAMEEQMMITRIRLERLFIR